MSNPFEKPYQPSPEEIKKAEEMADDVIQSEIMTEKQREETKERELVYYKEPDLKTTQAFKDVFGVDESSKSMEKHSQEVIMDIGWGTSYISYTEDLEELMVALGTSFDSRSNPEDLITDLQKIIEKRDQLIEKGYSISKNQAGNIYELIFKKNANQTKLSNNLEEVRNILGIEKLENKEIAPEQLEFLEKSNEVIDEYFMAYNSSRGRRTDVFGEKDDYIAFPVDNIIHLPENFDRTDVNQVRNVLQKIENSILQFKVSPGVYSESFIGLMHEEFANKEAININRDDLMIEFAKNKNESEGNAKWCPNGRFADGSRYSKDTDSRYKDDERERVKELSLLSAQFYKLGEKSLSDESLMLAKEAATHYDYYDKKWEKYLSIALAELVREDGNLTKAEGDEDYLRKAEDGLMVNLGSYNRDGIFPTQRKNGLANVVKIRWMAGQETDPTISKMATIEGHFPGVTENTKKCINLLDKAHALLKK